MNKKKLLWFIPVCLFILAVGFLSFRYAFLPKFPQEDPVTITVTFSSCVEEDIHTITRPDDISGIMGTLRSARFHRRTHHIPHDGGVNFSPIRFEFADGTVLLYTGVGASQFYFYEEGTKSLKQLYSMNQDDYDTFFRIVSKICVV